MTLGKLALAVLLLGTPGYAATLTLTAGTCTGSALKGTQYQPYGGCALTAAGGTAPYAFSYNKTTAFASLVEGLVLNSSTGTVTGTVYGEGNYPVNFIVTDSTGATANVTVNFLIAGNNALQGGCTLFPADSAMHMRVDSLPVDTSPAVTATVTYGSYPVVPIFGSNAGPFGIPYLYVPSTQPLESVGTKQYQSYFTQGPWPWYAPIEGSQNNSNATTYIGDGHSLLVQTGSPCSLWEMYNSQFNGTPYTNGPWLDGSNAYWPNIGSTGPGAYAMIPQDNGSTDAGGLPVTPFLVTYQEVAAGLIQHAIRFTLQHTMQYHVWPATAQAGTGSCTGGYEDGNHLLNQANPPTSCNSASAPEGEIFRLKASVATPACAATSPQAAVIITAMRQYGIILADNGGSKIYIIGTPDAGWNNTDLTCLSKLTFANFEPVNVSSVIKTLDSKGQPTVSYQTVSGSVTPLQPAVLSGNIITH